MNRTLLLILILIIPILLHGQDVQNLNAPESQNVVSCGAGFLTLAATSSINDNDLQFEWYESTESNGLQFLGSLDGSTGRSQFITPFLIADKRFAVRVRVGNSISPYTFVLAEILNEASILQQPEIEICGEAYLDIVTEMDSIENYQWQILVPNELGESTFENLNTVSSDSITLIALEAGFYRVIATDSTGCRAISSEVEVSNTSIVEFIESVAHCYDPGIVGDDQVTLTSTYGRSFTTFRWEESLDSVIFTEISTAQSITVDKPTVQSYDTAYYRLTITEQNCSNDTTIAVYWRAIPNGTISHIDPLINQNDFFYCGDDLVSERTLQFSTSSLGIEVVWASINHSSFLSQDSLKSYAGVGGPERLIIDFPQILLTSIGGGDETILTQDEGNLLPQNGGIPDEGGLIFAIVTDTIAGEACQSLTNGIFADTAFPLPLLGNALAYSDPFIPACLGEELEFTSYDKTADAYSWKQLDEATDLLIEVSTDDTLNINVDEGYNGGTYFLEVTKNGCTDLSQPFNVIAFDLPTVEITNIEDGEAIACDDIPSILLFGEGSESVSSYQWLYSIDDENFVNAPGDSANHFYIATLNGYYKLVASSLFCSAETSSVYVEIPDPVDPEFVLVAIEGEEQYCEGDEVLLQCNYESNTASYFWFYSFFQIDGDEVSIELVELGETTNPEITLDTRSFGSELAETLTLYFYILVIDGECIVGSTEIPHVVEINPSPNIEIVFSESPMVSELLFCSNEVVSQEVSVNNLSTVFLPDITYLWRKYNPVLDDYDTLIDASGTTYTISEPGRYQCLAVDSDGFCFSASNDLDVLILPSKVNGDTLFCQGNDINIRAVQGSLPDLNSFGYEWFYSADGVEFSTVEGESDPNLMIGANDVLYGNGFFYYEVQYDGCLGISDTLEVRQNINSFNSNLTVLANQEKGVPFEAVVDIDSESDFVYNWEPFDFLSFTNGRMAVFNFPESYPLDSVSIRLVVSNPEGCEVSYEELIRFEETTDISFSKFVSPNGDGLNDRFQINGLDNQVPNELRIVDSWGTTIFSYSNYYNNTQESDRLINSLKSEGVYYYLFSIDGNAMKGSFYFRK
ncbi:T9SS type B sorting domain-containing protein [Ekhidna sp.]